MGPCIKTLLSVKEIFLTISDAINCDAIEAGSPESKFTAPHFYLTMEIDMDNCIEGRKKINESSDIKISFNDIILKACAVALRKHPMVNSSFLGDKIRINHHVHIGVAVAVDEGLLVPVIRFADNKSLSHISSEVKSLAGKAKSKQFGRVEIPQEAFIGVLKINKET